MDSFLIDLWGWLKSNKELTRNNVQVMNFTSLTNQLQTFKLFTNYTRVSQTVSNAEMVANAIIEKVAIMLLQCADIEDQAGRYNKSHIF